MKWGDFLQWSVVELSWSSVFFYNYSFSKNRFSVHIGAGSQTNWCDCNSSKPWMSSYRMCACVTSHRWLHKDMVNLSTQTVKAVDRLGGREGKSHVIWCPACCSWAPAVICTGAVWDSCPRWIRGLHMSVKGHLGMNAPTPIHTYTAHAGAQVQEISRKCILHPLQGD